MAFSTYFGLIGVKEAAFPDNKNKFSKLSIYFIFINCNKLLNLFCVFFYFLKINSKANSNSTKTFLNLETCSSDYDCQNEGEFDWCIEVGANKYCGTYGYYIN